MIQEQNYLSLQKIANLAGVSKSAVTNWKSRFDDFPEPVLAVSSPRSPLYLKEQVFEWLIAHQKVNEDDLAGRQAYANMENILSWFDDVDSRAARVAIVFYSLYLINEGTSVQDIDFNKYYDYINYNKNLSSDFEQIFAKEEISEVFRYLESICQHFPVMDVLHHLTSGMEWSGRFVNPNMRATLYLEFIDSMMTIFGESGASDIVVYNPYCGFSDAAWCFRDINQIKFYGYEDNYLLAMLSDLRLKIYQMDGKVFAGSPLSEDVFKKINADVAIAIPRPENRVTGKSVEKFDGLSSLVHLPEEYKKEPVIIEDAISQLKPGGWGFVFTSPMIAEDPHLLDYRISMAERNGLRAIIEVPALFGKNSLKSSILWVFKKPDTDAGTSLIQFVDGKRSSSIYVDFVNILWGVVHGDDFEFEHSIIVDIFDQNFDLNQSWRPSLIVLEKPSSPELKSRIVAKTDSVERLMNRIAKNDSLEMFQTNYKTVENISLQNLIGVSLMPTSQYRARVMRKKHEFSQEPEPIISIWFNSNMLAGNYARNNDMPTKSDLFIVDTSVWDVDFLVYSINLQSASSSIDSLETGLDRVCIPKISLDEQKEFMRLAYEREELVENLRKCIEDIKEFNNLLVDFIIS